MRVALANWIERADFTRKTPALAQRVWPAGQKAVARKRVILTAEISNSPQNLQFRIVFLRIFLDYTENRCWHEREAQTTRRSQGEEHENANDYCQAGRYLRQLYDGRSGRPL
jgi:hypothetical protein